MKYNLFIGIYIICSLNTYSQTTENPFIEGGKLIVELVKVFKKNPSEKPANDQPGNVSDLCFSNTTKDSLTIDVFKKLNDTVYRLLPFSLLLSVGSLECMLGLTPAVYHYKISRKQKGITTILIEGDLRLKPNEKMQREIK